MPKQKNKNAKNLEEDNELYSKNARIEMNQVLPNNNKHVHN